MAFKMDDFKCEDCGKVTEFLVDTKLSLKEQGLKCECGSTNLTKIIGVGTGNKQHFSWAKWRADL